MSNENTTQAKLDQANWVRNILKKTEDEFKAAEFYSGVSENYTGSFKFSACEHPTVQKYGKEMRKLMDIMREELQKELDGIFK
jgi:hypothetical protein